MILNNLFPTPVAQFNLGSEMTIEELTFISQLKLRANKLNATSEDTYIFKYPEMKRIANFCNESLQEYFKAIYNPRYDTKLYITQSWANYTNKGQEHHKHRHANSIISGVFYVQAIKEVDKLIFETPTVPAFSIATNEFNLYNSEAWWIGVETGTLLLFPSYLAHMVEKVETEGTRISVSFNTFFKGHIGENENLTRLNIEI